MTTPLAPPADSPLAFLFGLVAASSLQAQEEERRAAEAAADDHVGRWFADTLARAIEAHEWSGHPALPDQEIEPSAVAALGGGWWLHHTAKEDPDTPELTLVVPCSCRSGYQEWDLATEADLLTVLTRLHRTGGSADHDGDPGGPHCTSIPRWADLTDGPRTAPAPQN